MVSTQPNNRSQELWSLKPGMMVYHRHLTTLERTNKLTEYVKNAMLVDS